MINKTTCSNLRKDMDQALQAVAEKYGLEISTKNMAFNDNEIDIKVKALVINRAGEVYVPGYEKLESLFPHLVDRIIADRQGEYRVKALKLTSTGKLARTRGKPKFVIVNTLTDEEFVAPLDWIESHKV